VRKDLAMPPGKLASQAGHAFLEAFRSAGVDRQSSYHADGLGTKICLEVNSLDKLLRLCDEAKALGIPFALIEDTGRNTTFGGVPTISAAGFGPIDKSEFPALRKLPLLP
jgi:peptidyl-tRNA hydrolase